jgi:hypothetical protein
MNYPAELVFGAACAAQRVNKEYVKAVKWPDVIMPNTPPSNRQLMMQFLSPDCDPLDEADMEQGREVRRYFQALTFKIMSGKVLSDFDANALALCNCDEFSTNYELAVVCSFPASFLRGRARDTVENRVKFAAGGFIGSIGDKVSFQVEVLRTFYSQQWNTHYVTAITADDQALFFSFKEGLDPGIVTITGTVKSHRDNQTQLNRVKVL